MNLKDILQRIRSVFAPAQPPIDDEVVLKFIKALESIQEEDISCSDFYSHVDEFVEREVTAKDADKIMPLLQEHLDMCGECCDEYEALLDVVKHTQDPQ